MANRRIQSRSESLSTSSYYSCLSSPTKRDGNFSASDYSLSDLEYPKKSFFIPVQQQSDASFSLGSELVHTDSLLNNSVSPSAFDSFFSSYSQTSNDTRSHSQSYTSQGLGYLTPPSPSSHPITTGTSDHYQCEDDFTRYLDNMLLSIANDASCKTNPSINSVHNTPQSKDTDWFWFGEVSTTLCDEGKDVDNEGPERVHALSHSNTTTSLPGLDLPHSFYCEPTSESDPESTSEFSSSGYAGTVSSPGTSALPAQELIFGGGHYYDNSSEDSSQKSDGSSFFARSISGHSPILPLSLKRSVPEDLRLGSDSSDENRVSASAKKRKTEAVLKSTLSASKSLTSVEFSATEPASLRKSSSLQSQNAFSESESHNARNPKVRLTYFSNSVLGSCTNMLFDNPRLSCH